MKYAFVIARVLLGLAFTVFGLNAFLHFFSNPPVPGLAGQFMGALLGSHYYVIAFGTELIGGALLLSNRYVPLALTVLGPVIVNILSFHIFLDSENMAPAIVVTVLWFVVFSEVRGSFAGLFVAKTAEVAAVAPKRWPVRSLGKMTFDKLNQVLSNGHRHDVDVHGNPHRAGLAREHAGIGKRQSRDEQRFLRGRQASKTLESKWQRLGRLQFQLPERENGTNMNSSPARPSSVSATLTSADHYRRLRIFVFGWVLVMTGAYCVCTNVFAQTSNSRTVEEPKPWTAITDSKSGDQTPERMPVRIIESHSQDGNRTSDKRSIEIRGTDGHLEPYQEIETETVNVDASTSGSTIRTFAWDVNGNKSLVQVTEEEKRILPGGDSKVTRLTSNPDLSGTLQPVQREIVETKKLGMEREETNVTAMLPNINGGLVPALKTHELRTRSANNAIESQKTTLLPDGAGNWQISEVRQATTIDEGASRTTEERVSRPDLEGKLSEISRAVSKESESTPGEKRSVVETYSVDVPGATRDGKLHLIERKTSTEKSSSSRERATEQTIEQTNLGDSGSGLRVSVLVNGRTVPGPSGERSTVTVRARDLNGNLGIVSLDTTNSDRIPIQIQQTPAAKP